MISALANSLLQTFDFPIAFVPSAKSGSNLYSQWAYRNPSNHYDTSTLYGQSITKARNVGGVELIIMHQGEADTNAHRTEAQYESDFATMIGHYRQDLYTSIPIFFCQLGTITIINDPRTDADVVAVRNAQHDLDNGVGNFMAATAMDQPRIDDVHYTVAGLNIIGAARGADVQVLSRGGFILPGTGNHFRLLCRWKPQHGGYSDQSPGWRRYNPCLRYYRILAIQ